MCLKVTMSYPLRDVSQWQALSNKDKKMIFLFTQDRTKHKGSGYITNPWGDSKKFVNLECFSSPRIA